MTAFITSFVMIILAEMGDKTQLLALAFASKYKISQVLLGAFIATLVLNTAAVGVGNLLIEIVPLKIISFIAALSFIFFGIWSFKKDDDKENITTKKYAHGPILTVALAFFLAELGDKTQLAAISLSVEYKSFFAVLAGSTLGMFLADAAGILAGSALKQYVPERYIKWGSALIFILFGLWSLWELL